MKSRSANSTLELPLAQQAFYHGTNGLRHSELGKTSSVAPMTLAEG